MQKAVFGSPIRIDARKEQSRCAREGVSPTPLATVNTLLEIRQLTPTLALKEAEEMTGITNEYRSELIGILNRLKRDEALPVTEEESIWDFLG